MFVRILLALVVWIPLIAQAENADEKTSAFAAKALNSSDLSGNLNKLEQYYSRVNQQMNRLMPPKARDPFADTAQTRPPESDTAADSNQDLFIPSRTKKAESPPKNGSGFSMLSKQEQEERGIPRMQFRGFIRMEGGKAGLLDISGLGTFVVKEGDNVGLHQMTSDTVVRIVEINPLNLIIEFGNLGEKVVIQ